MRKDTQRKPGVSKINAPIGTISPPLASAPPQSARRAEPAVSVTLSARYIDSRLKQFCLR